MYKIGVSCHGNILSDDTFRKLSDSGVDAIEISMAVDYLEDFDYDKTLEYAKRYNIELWSYHLPFHPFEIVDIATTDEVLRKKSVAFFEDLIKKSNAIGISKFVVHPSGEPIALEDRAAATKATMQSLNELAEIAFRYNSQIAVECLPRTCLGNTADEILNLISVNDKLRVCLDTNHLLIDDNLSFIEKLGDKIITLHVSDYDFTDEKHWLPGEGLVDWSALYNKLKEVGYNGVWMYEMGFSNPRPPVTRNRNLEFGDFVKNAKEIFEGNPLTKIG